MGAKRRAKHDSAKEARKVLQEASEDARMELSAAKLFSRAVYTLLMLALSTLAFAVYHFYGPGFASTDRPRPLVKQSEVPVWAAASETLQGAAQMNVTCAAVAGGDGSGSLGHCGEMRRANGCARFLFDDVIPSEHVKELQQMLSWLIREAWGAGSGPPSVVDLHAETISYKEQFANLTELMNFKSLQFTRKQVEAYTAVRQRLRRLVAEHFGIDPDALKHDMTFFSHINGSKTVHTLHDEYWHSHIDTDQYGSFAFTSLLYLNSQDEDFQGGDFVFEGVNQSAVEPRRGRVVAFSSDAENPHKVFKVSDGVRMALTAAFTCSTEKALSIEERDTTWEQQEFPKPSLVETA